MALEIDTLGQLQAFMEEHDLRFDQGTPVEVDGVWRVQFLMADVVGGPGSYASEIGEGDDLRAAVNAAADAVLRRRQRRKLVQHARDTGQV